MTAFVRMLGLPRIHSADRDVELPPGKTSALLYLLAHRGDWVSRDEMLALLYPETDELRARQNLRALLVRVRRSLGTGSVDIEPGRLRWSVPTDVAAFEEALAAGRIPLALELYTGPLLQGYTPTPSDAFDAWLQHERQHLERRWHAASVDLARSLDGQGRHLEAAALLAKAQLADPLDEPALRLQLRALAQAGDRTAALAVFEAFAHRLEEELAVEPEADTRALAQQIRDDGGLPEAEERTIGRTRGHDVARGADPLRGRRPPPPRPFIGRAAELTTALTQLRDPNCRLLSFVGAGGMGKTALALELAWRLDPDGDGTAIFVPLETATSVGAAIAMIGDAIGLTFYGRASPKTQLLEALAAGALMAAGDVLILDNLEHLPGMAELCAEILDHAAALRVVTTTRQPLGLRNEWLIDVRGLAVEDSAGHDAAQLFEAAARRSRPTFDLTAEADGVTAICRLVGGMPLALELAAAWVTTLGVRDIAASLSDRLELLQIDSVDRPARHSDLRSVFDGTWRRLDEAERSALAGLAPFAGSFTLQAALRVANVDPPMLRRLVLHALLWRQEDGRFAQHPLLARYARERARADVSAWEAALERHMTYFVEQLEHIGRATHDASEPASPDALADVANYLKAWAWATHRRRADQLTQAVGGLVAVGRASQQLQEVAEAVARAIGSVAESSAAQARLLRALGHLQLWSFEPAAALASLRRSVALSESLGDRRELGRTLFLLANAGLFGPAGAIDVRATWRRSLAICHEFGDVSYEGRALANLADYETDPHERERLLRAAVELLSAAGHRFGHALALSNLAHTLRSSFGAYAPARALFDEAIAIELTSGPSFRVAWWQVARIELDLDEGAVAELEAPLAEAERLAGTVRAGFGSFVADYAALGRGRLRLAQGDPEQAAQILRSVWHGESGRPDPYGYRTAAAGWYALAALHSGQRAEAEEAAVAVLATAPAPVTGSAHDWWPVGVVASTVLAELQSDRGDTAAAALLLGTALAAVRTLQLLPSALHLCLGAARLSAARGDGDAQRSLLALAAHAPEAAAHSRAAARLQLAQLGRSDVPANDAQATSLAAVLVMLEAVVTPSQGAR